MSLISFDLTAKTLEGLEPVLAKELEQLGAKNVRPGKRVVYFRGNLEMMYRANYELRTALRILKPIHSFQAKSPEELYDGMKQLRWSRYLETSQTFAIDSVVNSSFFEHSQYAALKAKDAIVDQFKDTFGIRPNVDTEAPHLLINLHIHESDVTVSLDSSGDPLFKRGYRQRTVEAPMNEVLAAGILLLSNWDMDTPLIDPMCGSGTLLIEAALLATNTPPQLARKLFSFQNWKDFDPQLWQNVRRNAIQQRTDIYFDMLGYDIDEEAVKAARSNLEAVGLSRIVRVEQESFFDLTDELGFGFIITNPPYGERLQPEPMEEFYAKMGDKLKQDFAGYDVWVFSGNVSAMKHFGLKASTKIPMLNAAIESTFQHFELYSGTKNA